MYNVFVVDDETWICQLIRKIVDWDSLGFRIIGSAGDGLTALDMIKQHKPDLVITDIRMPGIDGIGLIKAVREQKLDVEFIIISGYSDFEYARSALTFDAFAYILKPLDKEEFNNILLRIKTNLDNKKVLRSKLENSDTVMLKNDMRQIIDKVKDVSEQELNELYGTKFGAGCFYTIVFKRDCISRENKEYRENGDYQKFLSDIKEKNAERFKELIFFPGKTNEQEIFIVNLEKQDDNEVANAMKEAMKAFAGSGMVKNFFLTICIGIPVFQLSQIDVSYKAAAEAMKARVCLGVGRIIDIKKEMNRIANTKDVIDIREKKKLGVLFDLLDFDEASMELSRVFAEAEKHSDENLTIFHQTAYEIIDLLLSSMERKGILIKSGMTKQQAIQRIDDFMTKNEIEAFVCGLLKQFGRAYTDEKQNNGEKLILTIKKYISDNYMTNINLDDLAKMVCLSPTYVSELFKGKTGENLSEYLISYRIDIAKDFLKDIRYKVVDVSSMVGYKDSKYFSRLFKKKVGVNPTDYRRLYL